MSGIVRVGFVGLGDIGKPMATWPAGRQRDHAGQLDVEVPLAEVARRRLASGLGLPEEGR